MLLSVMTPRNEPAYVAMLVPFLRYLYCQPERRPEHGFLRQGLLRTLLPANAVGAPATLNKEREQDEDSPAFDSLLRCLCRLVPHMPVSTRKVSLTYKTIFLIR